MKNGTLRLCAYSLAHFAVDLVCAFVMFAFVKQWGDWALCVLIYNFCAFAMQMPLGIIADKLNKNGIMALVGCALVLISVCICVYPLLCAVFAGIGNAFFHVGGGVDVLNMSGKKAFRLGIFVSPGALGIYMGTLFAKHGRSVAIPLVWLILCAAAVLFSCFADGVIRLSNNSPVSLKPNFNAKNILSAAALFIVVAIRSYAGMIMTFEWKSAFLPALIAVVVVVLGKTTGGFLSDIAGSRLLSVFSLGLGGILFLFADSAPVGITAIFLFNMTMPVTLYELSKIMSGTKGLSFGMLTFALFLGFLPAYFGVKLPFGEKYMLAALSAVSLILMLPACKKRKSP